jgi:16S rRNA G966 N2-methylase RsmD
MVNKIENIDNKFKANYFPQTNGINYDNIKLTTEGVYSVSSIQSVKKMIKILKNIFGNNNITITDATANNGSDTIKLALEFNNINSIEIDKLNYSVLENNVNEYKLTNVNLYNGNSLEIIPKLTQDVIYIDAPWGGTNYKEKNTMSLYLDNKELSDIYNEYKKYTKLFIFKVPLNYNFTFFIQNTYVSKYNIYLYSKNNIKKFYFMIVST